MINGAHVIIYSRNAEADRRFLRDILMCDDIRTVTRSLQEHGIECFAPHQERWGILTHVSLPGGGRLGIYQPRHSRPGKPAASRKAAAVTNRKSRGASR
jgi:hypothetical protein